jgi:hypothetical protein
MAEYQVLMRLANGQGNMDRGQHVTRSSASSTHSCDCHIKHSMCWFYTANTSVITRALTILVINTTSKYKNKLLSSCIQSTCDNNRVYLYLLEEEGFLLNMNIKHHTKHTQRKSVTCRRNTLSTSKMLNWFSPLATKWKYFSNQRSPVCEIALLLEASQALPVLFFR